MDNLNISASEDVIKNFVINPNSQLGSIVRELLLDLTKGKNKLSDDDWLVSRAYQQIELILDALRRAVGLDGVAYDVMRMSPREVKEYVHDLPAEKQTEILGGYDRVWDMRLATHTINRGDYLPGKTGEMDVDTLEEAAGYYLGLNLESQTLDRLLISALLYAETVAFARSISGFPRPQYRYLLLRSGLSIVGEAFLLGLTFLLAGFIDDSFGIIFWIIVSVISLARWLRKDYQKEELIRQTMLLSDMANAQSKPSKRGFNPRLLRKLLYAYEVKGAVFSQYVYTILDRMISKDPDSSRCVF